MHYHLIKHKLAAASIILAVLTLSALIVYTSPKLPVRPSASGIIHGTLPLSEVSGAAMVGNNLLLVSDDPEDEDDEVKKYHMIVLLQNAMDRLKSKKTITLERTEQIYQRLLNNALKSDDAEFIADLEDIAISPEAGIVYLVSSHSQSSKGNHPDMRQRLIRVKFDPATGKILNASASPTSIITRLPESLKPSTKRKTDAVTDGQPDPGFNIEGMACDGEDLLLGLRSPMAGKNAILLRMSRVAAAFTEAGEAAETTLTPLHLDLEGMGIRGLFHDTVSKGFWIIGGASEDPKTPPPNDWTIWFWDGKNPPQAKLRKAELPDPIKTPEALCIVGDDVAGRSMLIVSDDDAKSPPASAYVLIPLELLGPPTPNRK